MNQEKLESAKNLFFIALGIDIAVTALVVISDVWGTGVLKDIGAGRSTADRATISTLEFWDSFSKLMLLTMLGVGLGLVKWLNTCYSYAKETLGASGFKNEGWTTGGWIIPVFNLFKPYQVINEIYKAGSPSYVVPDGWKKEGGSGLLLTWWIFWAVTHFIGLTVGKQMFKNAMRDDLTLQQSISAIEFHALFCVVFLIISCLWFLVAGNLTRRLLARQRVGGAAILQAQPIAVSQSVPSRNPSPTVPAAPPPGLTQLSASQAARTTSQATPNPVQFAIPTQPPAAMSLSASTDEDFWATAMAEVEAGPRRAGVWAKAFAESDGDETKTKVAYLKTRVQQLKDVERARQAEVAREQAVQHMPVDKDDAAKGESDPPAFSEAMNQLFGPDKNAQRLAQAITEFQSGKPPTVDEVIFLAEAAISNSSIAKLSDSLHSNTLLHWCARLQLDRAASGLLQLNADAAACNDEGKQAHQLARGIALKAMLATAANRPRGTCPNCATVMPLTSQMCPKCGAIFEEGAAWKLIPVKT